MTEMSVVSVHRVRERNIIRSVDGVEVLPPDVESKVVALRTLDGQAQATAVTAMLSHARTGLLAAIAAHDLPQIVEFKQKAAAIQEIAKQVRMGQEFQLDAAEFVRRAERGLGVAIRDGQARGAVARRGQGGHPPPGARDRSDSTISLPTAFATHSELNGRGGDGIYGLTDGVSDEQFDEAIAEARAEANLSRANVARKAKGKSKTAVDANDPLIDAEVEKPKKIRKTAAARKVIEDLVVSINGLVFIVNDTDPAEVDFEQHKTDIEGIRQGMNTIRRFLNNAEQEN